MAFTFLLFIKQSENSIFYYENRKNRMQKQMFIRIMALKFQYALERTIN
jgi:hypothetical protein